MECGGKQKGEVGGIRGDGKVDWGWRNGWDGGGGWGGGGSAGVIQKDNFFFCVNE